MLNLPKGSKGSKGASATELSPLEATTFYLGVVPVLLASLTSGICAALTQKTLQVRMYTCAHVCTHDRGWGHQLPVKNLNPHNPTTHLNAPRA